MSRSFLTGINLNKNELLNARIQNLALAPSSPVAGQIYFDTTDSTLRYYSGAAWLTLAQGGDVNAAIDTYFSTHSTDDLPEGTTNKYYSDSLVDSHLTGGDGISYSSGTIAVDLTPNGGLGVVLPDNTLGIKRSTVDTWYDAAGAAATAESNAITSANGYTDTAIGNLTTDTVTEGTTNKYFSDELAQDAVGNAVGTGLSYNDTTGAIAVDTTTIATKAYADSIAQGLNAKNSVVTYTTENIDVSATFNLNSVSGFYGQTMFSGVGDRVLVKHQTDATQNGIYIWTGTFSSATLVLEEAPANGDFVFVQSVSQGWIAYVLSGESTWTQFSAAGEYTAGNGIDITGTDISAKIDTLSGLSLGSGGLSVNVNAAGGLEKDSLTGALQVNLGTGLAVNLSNELTFASGYGVRKYAENNGALTASGGAVTWPVTHNLGTRDVTVQVFDNSGYGQVEVDVVHTSTSVVTLSWVSGDVSADAYRVVVVG